MYQIIKTKKNIEKNKTLRNCAFLRLTDLQGIQQFNLDEKGQSKAIKDKVIIKYRYANVLKYEKY